MIGRLAMRSLGVLGLVVGALLLGYWLINFIEAAGYDRGYAAAEKNCQTADIQRLTTLLESAAEQTEQAQVISLELSGLINQQVAQNARTTQELRHALTATAADRAACRFTADIMRQLNAARTRAASAATGGIRGAVSDPGETGG